MICLIMSLFTNLHYFPGGLILRFFFWGGGIFCCCKTCLKNQISSITWLLRGLYFAQWYGFCLLKWFRYRFLTTVHKYFVLCLYSNNIFKKNIFNCYEVPVNLEHFLSTCISWSLSTAKFQFICSNFSDHCIV